MKKIYLLVCVCVFSDSAFAQYKVLNNNEPLNVIDEVGLKQGKWVIYGTAKPDTCYLPTSKVEEGAFVDNKKTGVWERYYCSGKIKGKTTFKNGRPDGYTVMYHENGKMAEEGTWKVNKWVGDYRLYYENGQLQQEFSFNQVGKREGPQKYFFTNGTVMLEGSWANGKESGAIKEYYESGDLKSEKIFNNGEVDEATVKVYELKKPGKTKQENSNTAIAAKKAVINSDEETHASAVAHKGSTVLNGYYVLYNKNKQKTKEGTFVNNRLIDGKNYIYNANGVLDRIEIYKEGVYQGNAVIEE